MLMTIEFRWEEPAPPPRPTAVFETHVNPLTGENERAPSLASATSPEARAALPPSALPAGWEQTSRNAACPCGSGKKFKHCHGALV